MKNDKGITLVAENSTTSSAVVTATYEATDDKEFVV